MNRLEQELVNSCLQGNEKAFEDFVQSHARRIHAMSYRFTRCRAEAEDVTQEVFVRVYLTLSSYRAESNSLSGWLMHIARNLLIDRYRRSRRREQLWPILEPELAVSDLPAANPLQFLARNEAAVMVHAALQMISPKTRPVIELHYLEGLTLDEVAAILRIPVGTVKSRMTRGRRELARILRCPEDQQTRFGRRGSDKALDAIGKHEPSAAGARHAGLGVPNEPPECRMDLDGRLTGSGAFPRSGPAAWGEEIYRVVLSKS